MSDDTSPFPPSHHVGMSPELAALIERARNHVMTPAEKFEQRVSFVYGQQLDSPNPRTKDEIRAAIIEAQGAPDISAEIAAAEARGEARALAQVGDLIGLLSMLARQEGGEVRIRRRTLLQGPPGGITRADDPETGDIIIKAHRPADGV